jgi:hypothetical protein
VLTVAAWRTYAVCQPSRPHLPIQIRRFSGSSKVERKLARSSGEVTASPGWLCSPIMSFRPIRRATVSAAPAEIVCGAMAISGVREGLAVVSRLFIHPLPQRAQTTRTFLSTHDRACFWFLGFLQPALMFAVNKKRASHLPAATGASFLIAGAQGRRQDPKTPV